MLSVVIPTLNAGRSLATCLSALVPGSVSGLIKNGVIVLKRASYQPGDHESWNSLVAAVDDALAR